MSEFDEIKTAFERSEKILSIRPARGHETVVTKVRIRRGLTCEIEEGPWKLVADMPEKAGGHDLGPTPGTYGRGALGSCLAISYMMWAAKLEVPIKNIEVEVQAECDHGAMYGVVDGPAGYSELRYIVTIESSASEADIQRVVDEGDAHSPYLDVFSRSQHCHRQVKILPSPEE
jgi:uncharacterized OsmC-like protein